MIVDKKPNGGKSPNLSDAIMMCYNPKIKTGFFDMDWDEIGAEEESQMIE